MAWRSAQRGCEQIGRVGHFGCVAKISGPLVTRAVVPLGKPELLKGKLADRLIPVFEIAGRKVMMLTPELAGVPTKALGERVDNLARFHNTIVAALDLVFKGI